MKSMKQLAITILVGAFAVGAMAQEQVPAQGHLLVKTVVQKQETVVDEDGQQKVELVDANTVVPGDEVVYTVTFQNISDEPAENVVITNPIAENLVYVDGSAFGPGSDIVFSVDGGKLFASASDLSVSENGAVRPAEPSDFTHIRWQMQGDIPAGSQGVARFRAKLQ
jgi:uncharacterized repeat protein (TIGR01451 family)